MKRNNTLLLFIVSLFLLYSCKKSEDNTSPTPPTPEELLTKSSWKINELRYEQVNASGTGAIYYYKRGTTGNIGNFDNENIVFVNNNTGTFTLGSTVAPITWQFTNTEKTKLQLTINYSSGN